MNVDYINPILESIQEIFSKMADISLQPHSPTIKKGNLTMGDVTGIVDMSGDDIRGSLSITFKKNVILELAHIILEENFKEINEDVEDCVAEITNMICGDAKSRLSEHGYNFQMQAPRTLSAPEHSINHGIPAPTIIMPFISEYGPLYVEVCFKDGRKNQH